MMMQPHIILIARALNVGGIETLIVRLARAYCDAGQQVTVVAQGGTLLPSLPKQVQLLEYTELSLSQLQQLARHMSGITAHPLQLISFEPTTRFMAEYLAQKILCVRHECSIHHISGCFHPRAYRLESELKLRWFAHRWLANAFGNELLFFMNEVCRDGHLGLLRGIGAHSATYPVPVRVATQAWQPNPSADVLEIISVGRLVAFKQYVFGLVAAVDALIAQGHALRLTIYGYGEQEQALQNAIAALEHSNAISFKGALDYEAFEQEVRRYDVFVGSGTAAMEAAAMGIPTLIAIDSEMHECYGLIQQLPLGMSGEILPHQPRISFEKAIEEHLALSQKQRHEIGLQARDLYSQLSPAAYVNQLNALAERMPLLTRSKQRTALLMLYVALLYQCSRWVGRKIKWSK